MFLSLNQPTACWIDFTQARKFSTKSIIRVMVIKNSIAADTLRAIKGSMLLPWVVMAHIGRDKVNV